MTGFLSPEGEFFKCKYSGHLNKAEAICKEKYGKDMRGMDAENFLYDEGYVVFYARNAAFRFFPSIGTETHVLTSEQIDFILAHLDSIRPESQQKDLLNMLEVCEERQSGMILGAMERKYVPTSDKE